MGGRGQAPKEQRSRERDNHTFEQIEDTGKVFGKPLPVGILPNDEEWHPQTLALWDSVRRFPSLEHEPELGWQMLVDTMLLSHVMWTKGKWEHAAELRLRLAKYGATPEDRMRLKIKVVTPADTDTSVASQPAGVTSISSRRGRLAEDA